MRVRAGLGVAVVRRRVGRGDGLAGHRAHRARLLLAQPEARHVGQPARGRQGAEGAQAVQRSEREARRAPRASSARTARSPASRRRSQRRARAGTRSGRPSAPSTSAPRRASKLLAFNRRLRAKCKYGSIQAAVTASGNNDRVVIMPGLYTEPTSRAAPTHDPKCADLKQVNDRQDDTGANRAARCPTPTRSSAPTTRT